MDLKKFKPLIDSFLVWFKNDPHSKIEDYYADTITSEILHNLTKEEFIDFFYNFVGEGGKIQSGGHRSKNKFKETMLEKFSWCRDYLLEPFNANFNEKNWLTKNTEFPYLGLGVATIFLNRINKNKFPVFNNKTADGLKLLGYNLTGNPAKKYSQVRLVQKKLITAFPELNNFFMADSLNHYIVAVDEGKNLIQKIIGQSPNLAEQDNNIESTVNTVSSNPVKPANGLNTILYGPPGTGKTYMTANLAVEICDGHVPGSREEIMRRYKVLIAEQRISFVSFHQSFSYEEFIEGIRPVMEQKADSQEEQLAYKIEEGIFKNICRMAKGSIAQRKHIGNKLESLENRQIFKMSVGGKYDPHVEEFCFQNNYVALGWGGDVDYSKIPKEKDWEKAKAAIIKLMKDSDYDQANKRFPRQAVYSFKNWMDIGDIVIVSRGLKQAQAFGVIEGEYEYKPDVFGGNEYCHFRKVKWLIVDAEIPVEKIQDKIFSQQTIYNFNKNALKLDFLTEILCGKETRESSEPENHVLIIDEINRGNISKILGELITLIEPDKRLGQENELKVQLPYSGEEFGVPSNLHIIGTMNTADRSIAFLDTALRRRFQFREVMPDSKIIRENIGNGGVVKGVDVAQLLSVLNQRVEILYDRDHQIGHSYFLTIDCLATLRDTFLNSIIPLLKEYFYEDWEKICAVLGCPHDEVGKPTTSNISPIISYKPVAAEAIPGFNNEDLEDRLHYSINNSFIVAGEDELTKYFLSTINPNSTSSLNNKEEGE